MSTAGSLSIGTVLLLLFGIKAETKRKRCICWGMFVIAIIALLYTETRGAWIAVAVTAISSCFFAAHSIKKCLIAFAVTAVLLAGVISLSPSLQERMATFTNQDYQSNAERIRIWTSSWNMFLDHPVLGVGMGQYEHEYQTKYILPSAKERGLGHAHSNIMQMLGERGIVGCIAFLGMWGYLTWFSLRGWWERKELAYLVFFAMLTGMMLQGLTEYNMGNSVVTKLFWFSLAICMQWIRLSREEMET